jgi:hypothetical protein
MAAVSRSQAQEEYERRLKEEMDATALKEAEIEHLVRAQRLALGYGV